MDNTLHQLDAKGGNLFLVEKEKNWTSFDVVNFLKKRLSIKKIGHAGTLDPLATGLLVLCSGIKTKQIQEIQNMPKEYTGTFVVGSTTPSFDLETLPQPVCSHFKYFSEKVIRQSCATFIGEIEQTPPIYSAVKIKGVPSYKMARKGKSPILKPKLVYIEKFEITDIDLPAISFKIICSKGTYIRSLARDLGKKLGIGAYLSQLCRTRIGEYSLKKAEKVDEIVKKYS